MTTLNRVRRVDKAGCEFEVGRCDLESSLRSLTHDGFARPNKSWAPPLKSKSETGGLTSFEFGRNFQSGLMETQWATPRHSGLRQE
jgi:hypothetical protein